MQKIECTGHFDNLFLSFIRFSKQSAIISQHRNNSLVFVMEYRMFSLRQELNFQILFRQIPDFKGLSNHCRKQIPSLYAYFCYFFLFSYVSSLSSPISDNPNNTDSEVQFKEFLAIKFLPFPNYILISSNFLI